MMLSEIFVDFGEFSQVRARQLNFLHGRIASSETVYSLWRALDFSFCFFVFLLNCRFGCIASRQTVWLSGARPTFGQKCLGLFFPRLFHCKARSDDIHAHWRSRHQGCVTPWGKSELWPVSWTGAVNCLPGWKCRLAQTLITFSRRDFGCTGGWVGKIEPHSCRHPSTD